MPEGSAYFVWGSPPRAPARVCGRRTPAPRIRGWPSTSSATTRRSARAAIAARDSRSSPTRTSRTTWRTASGTVSPSSDKAPYLYDRRDRLPLGNRQEDFHLRRGSDRTLGATLVAAHAGEMISELTLAMVGGLGLGKIAATIHPYPTQAEVVKRAGDAYNRTRLTPTVRRLFERCECPRNEGAGAGIQRSWGGGSHGPARRRREGCASSLQRGSPDPGTRALLSDLVRSRLARGDS